MDPIQESSIDWVPIAVGFITVILSGTVSYFVSRFTTKFSQDKEYENNYYKTIIEYRLDAYNILNDYIVLFESHVDKVVNNKDNFLCHAALSSLERLSSYNEFHNQLLKKNMWLGKGVTNHILMLSQIINSQNFNSDVDAISLDATKYNEIEKIVVKLRADYVRDILTLHQVPKFLKSKV